ncbi:hypothetical protein PVAND_002316 [Polypedilum vanderplanki]|uniref:Protein YIPF n=1 Tax=Polypedilum vanderplanki TaxID=319348 RepID=A0A9J6BRT5_POLVA|nr:hypothetical protein PVAND_002316 [Polypedilum vanderplanki]
MSSATGDLLAFKDYDDFADSAQISVNSPKKVPQNESEPSTPKVSMFQIEFYQQFFNIDTAEVVERIVNSMYPKRATASYLKTNLGVNPDLYGPFWIATTLIFTIAISGNLADFLQKDDFKWHYNFHLVSYASTCIILYVCLMPFVIWSVLKYSVDLSDDSNPDLESAPYIPSLLSIVCLYGYSLAVYIPVSVLWTIQISFLQWVLVLGGAFLSGSVLINVLMPSIKLSKYSLFLIIGIASAHFILAAGFMLWLFHVPSSSSHHIDSVVTHEIIISAQNQTG